MIEYQIIAYWDSPPETTTYLHSDLGKAMRAAEALFHHYEIISLKLDIKQNQQVIRSMSFRSWVEAEQATKLLRAFS